MRAADLPIPAPPDLEEAESAQPVPRPKSATPKHDADDARLLDAFDTIEESDGVFANDFSDAVGCGSSGCSSDGCGACGLGAGYYVRSEFLQWWTNGTRLPVLLTGSENGRGGGVLDDPDTTILWGGTRVNNRGRSGFRVTLGYWFDPCQNCGWEVDYFDLGLQPTSMGTDCFLGDGVLARPFYDVVNENEASQLICYPGYSAGEFGVQSRHYFMSTGARIRRTLLNYTKCPPCGVDCGVDCGSDCGDACLTEEGSTLRGQCGTSACGAIGGCGATTLRLDGIAGYRYYRMTDNLDIHEGVFLTNTNTQAQVGTIFQIDERFHASNTFHGGELGLIARVDKGCWSFEFLAKMALGNNRQRVLIDGRTVIAVPDQDPVTYQGGLLALPTNIGVYTRNRFAVIPQFGMEVGYQVTGCMRIYAGYDLLYWSNIVGAGDQIDLGVDANQLPPALPNGATRPAFTWQESHFWAQGIRLGSELRF